MNSPFFHNHIQEEEIIIKTKNIVGADMQDMPLPLFLIYLMIKPELILKVKKSTVTNSTKH